MASAALHRLGRAELIVECFSSVGPAAAVRTLLDKRLNSPETSSCGRLFDAACGLLGVKPIATYEGEAPMVLESLVGHAKKALDLTGDAEMVELAFQRLRVEREVKGESRPLLEGRPRPKGIKRTPVVYTMTRAQLGELPAA